MNREKIRSFILVLIKIFFVGLVLQFLIQTFITFQLGGDGSFWNFVWMRKEIIILILTVLVGLGYAGMKKFSHPLWKFILLFMATGLIFLVFSVFIQKVGVSPFVLTVKYDLLPFFIWGLGICVALFFLTEQDRSIIHLYHKIVKFGLRGGFFWLLLIYFMPTGLKFFGYDPYSREGTIDARPPAVYYTLISPYAQGSMLRNQFLFERPINFGFWLVAFFPVFALGFLRKKSIKKQIFYTIGFGLLVLSTWSRAAIVIFAVEVLAIMFILHWKNIKKYLPLFIIICVLGAGGIGVFGNKYFAREHSTTGHFALIAEGRILAKDHLITGRGAGYAGPASHQICFNALENELENERCAKITSINDKYEITTYGFNPENQFLQIIMEYGLVGFIARMAMICWIIRYSIQILKKMHNNLKTEPQKLIYFTVMGCTIGLIGLLGEGMLLHSFSDRMVVYPFFLLYGISLGLAEKV
ncbi:hypothetical protein AGMMS50249_2340 [candidate division SR1 bacterium]|nr:hypothetical protein AGMMS50249_2340 [candidate division SR1 bacterium]